MEIALRVVQFWSEIKLVITNFVITRFISDQIALHLVQLPLFIQRSADVHTTLRLTLEYDVITTFKQRLADVQTTLNQHSKYAR